MACIGIPVEATYSLSEFRKTQHMQVATCRRSHITAGGKSRPRQMPRPGLTLQHRVPEASATSTLSSSWPSLRPLVPTENNDCSKIKAAILCTSANVWVMASWGWATRETLLVMTINAREQSPHLFPHADCSEWGVTVAVVREKSENTELVPPERSELQ